MILLRVCTRINLLFQKANNAANLEIVGTFVKTEYCRSVSCKPRSAGAKTAKVLILLVVAYALSPIDIIPDFVPILGYLDDLIVLPLGIALAIRLIPKGSLGGMLPENQRAGFGPPPGQSDRRCCDCGRVAVRAGNNLPDGVEV